MRAVPLTSHNHHPQNPPHPFGTLLNIASDPPFPGHIVDCIGFPVEQRALSTASKTAPHTQLLCILGHPHPPRTAMTFVVEIPARVFHHIQQTHKVHPLTWLNKQLDLYLFHDGRTHMDVARDMNTSLRGVAIHAAHRADNMLVELWPMPTYSARQLAGIHKRSTRGGLTGQKKAAEASYLRTHKHLGGIRAALESLEALRADLPKLSTVLLRARIDTIIRKLQQAEGR